MEARYAELRNGPYQPSSVTGMKINMFSPVYLVLALTSCQGVLQRDGQALPNGTVSTVGRGKAERTQDTGSSPSPKMREWMQKDCRAGLSEDEFIPCIRALAAELPPLDSAKRDHFGERYSPKEWLACMERGYARSGVYGTGGCENYRLRRAANPEYWPSTTPPIQWPEAPKEVVYRSGMSSKEYFEALCKAEAGEFIYKTIPNVEGVYQIRPRHEESDTAMQDRYVMEDPYGYDRAELPKYLPEQIVQPTYGRYRFVDIPSENTIVHHFRDEAIQTGKKIQVPFQRSGYIVPYIVAIKNIEQPKARYGFTWRGISHPNDRRLGIAGGELAVVDLQTGELVALRRGFRRSGYMKNASGFWWMTAQHCSQKLAQPGYRFIEKVLQRVDDLNDSFIENILKKQDSIGRNQ